MTFLLQASLFAALAVSYQAGEMSLNDVVQKVNPKMSRSMAPEVSKVYQPMAQAFWSAPMAMFLPLPTI